MKVAIIGCGLIASTHIEGLIKINQEISALCDINSDSAIKLKAKYNLLCPIFSDYKKMLDEIKINVVHVLVPHFLHTEMIIYALEKNINVLCEKPVCIKEDEADKIRLALKKSKGQLGVNFQSRYLHTYRKIKEIIDKCQIINATAMILWHRDEKYYQAVAGRGNKATDGGGVMMCQAIHTLDFLLWLLGMPKFITANISNRHVQNIIDSEDTADVYLEMDKGNIVFYATTACSRSYPIELNFDTDQGLIELRNNQLFFNHQEIVIPENKGIIEFPTEAHYRFIADFYDCLENEKPFALDFEEGFKAVKVVLSIYKSLGQRIKFN